MAIKKNAPTTIEATPETETKNDVLAIFGTSAPALASDVPEYLREQVGNTEGSENVGQDDQLIPRLAIAQMGQSPQTKKASELYIPGLQDGQFFNTLTNEIYGEEVVVVPILFFKNFIEFKSMDDGGGVIAMYNNAGEVPPAKLAFQGGNKPAVTEFKNRLCLLLREGYKPELIVVSFKSSGLKAAKKWNSLIKGTNLPAYARTYTLKTVPKQKGQQSWHVADVFPGQFVPQAFFNQAKEYFDNLSEGGYKVDVTGLEDTETSEETPF